MGHKKGMGLLMVWADIPADKEEEFNRWYNDEHLADLLAIPGVLNAARYTAVRGGPKYLACYELECPEVVETEGFRTLRENPSEWSRRMSPSRIGTNYISNVYRLIFPDHLTQVFAQTYMAPALQIGRMDVPLDMDVEFNQWYNTVYIPNYEKVPGCISGRRYMAVKGQPRYLVVYEFEHEKVSESKEWAVAREANPWSERVRARMKHAPGSPGVYKKIFP